MRSVFMKMQRMNRDPGTALIEQVTSGFHLVGYLTAVSAITTFVLWIWYL